MTEITCPNCHKTFRMEGTEYSQIVAQIRDEEFEKQLEVLSKSSVRERELELSKSHMEEMSKKEVEIQRLKSNLEKSESDKILAMHSARENYDNMLRLKDEEFERQLEVLSKSSVQERELELSRLHMEEIRKRDEENRRLTSEVERLNDKLSNAASTLEMNVEMEVQKISLQKDVEIQRLKSNLEKNENEKNLALKNAQESYDAMVRFKDEEISHYKDFKARMSTKMIGESLEQHCLNSFNQIRATAFPYAYFEKDNDTVTGTKGDFIFRDYQDGIEYISVMFEMKNEMEAEDSRSTKHRNEEFLAKLDKDRREKNCEYAVLVSLLEPDSELYNTGIVDVSYRFPKMYVIRPQFFIPIITILRNAAKGSVEYKRELALVRSQNIDIQNFSDKLEAFQKDFGYNVDQIGKKFEDAIKEIDKSIAALQKTRDDLMSCQKNFRIANDKAQALEVKKLLKDSPSLAVQLNN